MKKTILFFLFLIIILGSIYTGGWFYFAGIIDREVQGFIDDQKKQNIIFDGQMTPAYGFPGPYKISYTGEIKTPDATFIIPSLDISGIPLEGQQMTASAPLGMEIQNVRNIPKHLKKITHASLTFEIPKKMPPELTYPYLKVWQFEGNANIYIPSLSFQWEDAAITGEANLRLNDDLQPEGEATIGVTNHNFFVTLIAEEIGISKTQKLMVLAFLNALNKDNGAIVIPLRIQNNALYMNMMRLTPLPFIYWPGAVNPLGFSGRERPGNLLVQPQ